MSTKEHTVRIEPHGRSVRVREDQPVLEAALAAGLNLPHSCKSGHCSSCRAQLLQGEIRYPGVRPLGITAEEERSGKILLCQARPLTDLAVEARLSAPVADVEIKTLPSRIAGLNLLAPDVMQVLLRLPSVERLRFHAGQYLDVLLEGGKRRSFSIASPPHDSELIELHVRRVSGGGFTERLFGAPGSTEAPLGVGSLLRIEGPIGQFSYREGHSPILMLAGGTGFAPLKSMLRHVLETGRRREIHFYWGARHAHDLYEQARVLEWVRREPRLSFNAVLSEASAAEAAHCRVGLVHEAVLADHAHLDDFEVYAAGPPAMIEAIRSEFPRRGLRAGRLYFDSFDYAPDARR
ncbi:MAG: 2Fe-2S iron-sulfur cluster binding domain-containing protein [Sinobacteraceae bacterium]|nr:2Fe-2S iron-sulfur cluster binding domain-containing protein [Nevskiaceae bacterium]MBV9317860.1 2Fe-2S iron-sulfur cluster binding domain-containing protein [Gammaproteobacteria bacterium]